MLLPRFWLTRECFSLSDIFSELSNVISEEYVHWSRWIKIFGTNIYRHIAHCLSQRLMQWLCDFCIAAIWYQSLIGKRQTIGLLVKIKYHTYDSCLALINSWKIQLKRNHLKNKVSLKLIGGLSILRLMLKFSNIQIGAVRPFFQKINYFNKICWTWVIGMYGTHSMVVVQFIKFSLSWVSQSFTGFASTFLV
jgi:hypothetical protein